MINWNEVTVGETEIEGKSVPTRWCILGIDDNQVWVKRVNRQYPESVYQIFSKQFINETYNIYDPWVDVSERVKYVKVRTKEIDVYALILDNVLIPVDSKDFKVERDGRRVWKRKEG